MISAFVVRCLNSTKASGGNKLAGLSLNLQDRFSHDMSVMLSENMPCTSKVNTCMCSLNITLRIKGDVLSLRNWARCKSKTDIVLINGIVIQGHSMSLPDFKQYM